MSFGGALIVAAILQATQAPPLTLSLTFVDVGQGDAALLITPERRTMLVDAGRNGAAVIALLRANHIDTLDLVVVSHIHADHMGGIPAVLGAIPVRYFMDNGRPSARAHGHYLRAIEASGAQYLQATARTISLGSVSIRVVPPPDERLRLAAAEQNNRSVGLIVRYGQFRALLAGDSQREELRYWLMTDSISPVTLVKVSHHGSDNGTTTEWVAQTQPQLAVISVGRRNGYGHPGAAAVGAWCEAGVYVARTDLSGSIHVTADSTGALRVWSQLAGPDQPPVNNCARRR